MDILLSLCRRTPAPDHYRFLANGLGAELYDCRYDYQDHRKRPGKSNISEAIATREYLRYDCFRSLFSGMVTLVTFIKVERAPNKVLFWTSVRLSLW